MAVTPVWPHGRRHNGTGTSLRSAPFGASPYARCQGAVLIRKPRIALYRTMKSPTTAETISMVGLAQRASVILLYLGTFGRADQVLRVGRRRRFRARRDGWGDFRAWNESSPLLRNAVAGTRRPGPRSRTVYAGSA